MKPLTSSVFSFEKLRQDGFLYVDKTEYLWQLIKNSYESYSLFRPCGFGKSLMISTLKAIFEGRKELFEGLAIYDKPYDWKKYPVLHLSFDDYIPGRNPVDELQGYLQNKVQTLALEHDIRLAGSMPTLWLDELIRRLYDRDGEVVILLDECDKPIRDNLLLPEIKKIHRQLYGFFSTLKVCNEYEHFLLIAGECAFAQDHLATGFNHLTDISMDARFATMLGYTQEELEANFADYMEQAAAKNNLSLEECKAKLKDWYNGFRFEEGAKTVYNPISITKFFEQGDIFKNFWPAAGMLTSLPEIMKHENFDLREVITQPVSQFAFFPCEVERLSLWTLLLQQGYLTIDHAEPYYNERVFFLRVPNREAESVFQSLGLE